MQPMMRALVKEARGVGQVKLVQRPLPEPGPAEALIRVQMAGVCGTDVHIYHDRFPNTPPMVLGHEFSGMIERLGPDTQGFVVGDRVVSANNPFACGSCRVCRDGFPNLCPHKRAMGIHSDGAFADYVKLPVHLLHQMPDNVSFAEAALMEPLAVAIHAVIRRGGVRPGDMVAVFGPGAIGILAAQVARAAGAAAVILIGTSRDEMRLTCARSLGLTTLNTDQEEVVENLLQRTQGRGVDMVVEASGSPHAITQAVRSLSRNGRIVATGITGKTDISLAWDRLISQGASLHFAYSSINADWQQGLAYLAEGKVLTEPLITHIFALEDWQQAFEQLERMEAIRPVFRIGAPLEERRDQNTSVARSAPRVKTRRGGTFSS